MAPRLSTTRRKQSNLPTSQKQIDWLDFMDGCNQLAIPIGPRFQADVPAWTGPSSHYSADSDSESNTSKWFGTQVWPVKDRSTENKEDVEIGKGRPDFCECVPPGSVECIKRHITDKRTELQYDLGPAFWSWKFDDMGEEVSKLWTLQEEANFATLLSEGKSFVEPAMDCFHLKTKESLVNYYFNVFVPRRISRHTMSGRKVDDSDDNDDTVGGGSRAKDSRKKGQVDNVGLRSSKRAKTRYLSWRR